MTIGFLFIRMYNKIQREKWLQCWMFLLARRGAGAGVQVTISYVWNSLFAFRNTNKQTHSIINKKTFLWASCELKCALLAVKCETSNNLINCPNLKQITRVMLRYAQCVSHFVRTWKKTLTHFYYKTNKKKTHSTEALVVFIIYFLIF